MEIRHLRLIKAIVEEGSITKAIDKLHLTQSALSHQLKEAEYQVGTKLFLRQNKRLVLTKAGEKWYETATMVLDKLIETEKEVRSLLIGEVGEIRISTECYSSYHWLPSVLKQFHLLYPNIELKLVVEATHYPLKKLLDNVLDVAIISDVLEEATIQYIELFQDEVVMVVAENHQWATKAYVLAEDFVNEHLFIHSLPLETVTVHQFFLAPSGVSPQKITPLPLTEASIEMVKADMGVMAMAKWAALPYLKNGELKTVKIGKNGLKRKHYIAFRAHQAYPAYFERFVEFLQSEINLQWNT
ncbi:LysR family transcriptional regulator for metE and metH [Spirosoma oryzae]|uniref:LysR family transcriptional regulator for metE and metH n=1 Tax=Spirosoma oryzae TaxID=1469603 RepID=A0A2T0T358_9BACT|nr:LysR family transcriptional regulator [Spirosoma oryzae]PRY40069.1 LysR family transcriptional regulator for metE and metH [Spirosoma oryzae]